MYQPNEWPEILHDQLWLGGPRPYGEPTAGRVDHVESCLPVSAGTSSTSQSNTEQRLLDVGVRTGAFWPYVLVVVIDRQNRRAVMGQTHFFTAIQPVNKCICFFLSTEYSGNVMGDKDLDCTRLEKAEEALDNQPPCCQRTNARDALEWVT